MNEAMGQVREHLGPDAIIVSTQEDAVGDMCVTAALELADTDDKFADAVPDVIDVLGEVLVAHGLSPELVEDILAAALPYHRETPLVALSSALSKHCAFKPVAEEKRALMLMGPPGAGKTVTIAKLAARARMARQPVRLVSADRSRAGGIDQLAAFARVLELPLTIIESARDLEPFCAPHAGLTLIDTAGINPYESSERKELAEFATASGAEPMLVLGAGGDVVDTAEMARIFRDLGCARLTVTRLDMVRRLGSIIAAAVDLRLPFAEAGISAAIADGLTPFSPVLFARLLLSAAAGARKRGDL
jgi:flagellar biosynthesis protein FlhF